MYTQLIVLVCFIAFPYLLVLARNLIWDIYLWQTKEYRLDRVWSQWRYEKDKGLRNELFTVLKIGFFTFVVAFTLVPEQEILAIAFVLSYFLYWYQGLEFLQKLIKKKLMRPQLKSLRNLLIGGFSLFMLLIPFVMVVIWLATLNYSSEASVTQQAILSSKATFGEIIKLFIPKSIDGVVVIKAEYIVVAMITGLGIISDLLCPVWVALAVWVTSPLATIKRRLLIAKATKKIRTLKQLKVVAVTGSYGKSTTKELLAQILSMKFNIVKTEKNNNTDIGIALTILKKLNTDTQVFVAEMGAYKIGETKDCCLIAPPDVAIITGVDQQHVSLFGGIKEVLASTYEVIDEMQPQGLAILNGDNEYCLRLAEKTSKRKMLYYSVHNASKIEASELDYEDADVIKHKISFPGNENVFVKSIKVTKTGLSFDLAFAGKTYKVKTNLQASYNISNLMAAVLTAVELGVPMQEVIDIINNLDFEVPYLNIHDGINGTKILDDGYNANPTGFISALKYLDSLKYKSKKWVFTQGLIELGPERSTTNKKIAAEIVKVVDALYTTDSALYEQVKILKPDFEAKMVRSVFDFTAYYEAYVKKGDLVLIEGSFPQDVLKQIYANYYK